MGSRIRPLLTPDRIDAVMQIIQRKTGASVYHEDTSEIIDLPRR